MTDQRTLVLFDADNISDYVFETGRLKEIRGGSWLIRKLTEPAAIQKLAAQYDNTSHVIYAGGGAGLVRFASEQGAEQFATALRCNYRQTTIGGSLTAVCSPYTGSFATALEQAQQALRQRKGASRQQDHQFAAGPYTTICLSCGRRPVSDEYQGDLLCAACTAKRSAANQRRLAARHLPQRGDNRQEEGITLYDLALTGDPLAPAFLKRSSQAWLDARLPEELDDLGRFSFPHNYLGVIHADGNRMGEHLRYFTHQMTELCGSDQEQEEKYGLFSQAIADTTAEAIAIALAQALPQPHYFHAEAQALFDNVLLAGDDVVLFVTADKALDVAIDFCDEFQQRMEGKAAALGYIRPITMAAGVVLANVHQPILYLQQQAKDLLRSAKKLCAQQHRVNKPQNAVDFSVVTTPILRPFKTVRMQDYQMIRDDRIETNNPVPHTMLQLTRRPYTTNDLRDLLWLGRQLKGLVASKAAISSLDQRAYPRNQLNTLYDAIFQGYAAAALQGARAALRVAPHQRELLLQFAEHFACNNPLPWGVTSDGQIFTAFTDLVEIYDFLHDAKSKPAYKPKTQTVPEVTYG